MHTQPATRTQLGNTSYRPPFGSSLFFSSPELVGTSIPYTKGTEIYGVNEPAEYLYKVLRGTVCSYKILSDGRRQVERFYFAGDVLGLEAGSDHQSSVEALSDCMLLIVKRSTVLSVATRYPEVAKQLWNYTASELNSARDHATLLVKSAHERVAHFLLEVARRLAANEIQLPMSRQDIADYLGLTIETVSRTFTQFRDEAAIDLPTSRRVVIRNRGALGYLDS